MDQLDPTIARAVTAVAMPVPVRRLELCLGADLADPATQARLLCEAAEAAAVLVWGRAASPTSTAGEPSGAGWLVATVTDGVVVLRRRAPGDVLGGRADRPVLRLVGDHGGALLVGSGAWLRRRLASLPRTAAA